MAWTIIAKQGPDRYLLVDGSVDPVTKLELGRILDKTTGIMYKKFYVGSIVARGYWEPYDGTQDIVEKLVASVRQEPGEWDMVGGVPIGEKK